MAAERRQDRDDVEEGAPDWMVTYGDMMTLLLTFFVLLFSFSTIDIAKYSQVAGSLRDFFGVENPNLEAVPIDEQLQLLSVILEQVEDNRKRGTPHELVQGDSPRVKAVDTGLHIVLQGEAHFAAGSDRLTDEARESLRDLWREQKIAGRRNRIIVKGAAAPQEGAFAGTPPAGVTDEQHKRRFLRDLSYRRAAAVADELIEIGVPPELMRVSAAGIHEPVGDALDQPHRQRRVDIVITGEHVGTGGETQSTPLGRRLQDGDDDAGSTPAPDDPGGGR